MAPALNSQFCSAIERLYAAALDPAEWTSFLAEAATLFGADNAYISRVEHDTRILDYVVLKQPGRIPVSVGRNPALMIDDRRKLTVSNNLSGNISSGFAHQPTIVSAASRLRERQGVPKSPGVDYTLVVGLPETTTINRVLGLTRNPSGKPFTAAERALLDELVPHLRRALSICQQMALRAQPQDKLARILEGLPYGVLVVNRAGAVRWMNSAARELLSHKRGLRLHQGCIAIDGIDDRAKLNAALLAAVANGGDGSAPRPARVKLANGIDDTALSLTVNAFPSGDAARLADVEEALAVITIVPQRQANGPDIDMTRQILGLSPTQARIATLLSSGQTLKEVAGRIGVTEGTARQYLKIIFRKTGVRRQSDLVRLIADVPTMSVARLSS